MKIKTLSTITLFTYILIATSCVSWLGRPMVVGTITDFDGNPIDSCIVGETITDTNGSFTLEERRYRTFFLVEIFQREAPPSVVFELVEKEGYQSKIIKTFSAFGGSAGKGTVWGVDTVYLKNIYSTNAEKLLQDKWDISFNTNQDTLCLIKTDFGRVCHTFACNYFWNEYSKYAHPYYHGSREYLPNDIFDKFIKINFNTDKTFDAQKIVRKLENRLSVSDTTQIQGTWHFNDSLTIDIKSELPELNGSFIIDEIDYEYMRWKKLSSKH